MLCRLCAYEVLQKESFSIFDDNEETTITKLIVKFLDLEVYCDKSASNVICQSCYNNLNKFNEFYDFVKQRQIVLKNENSDTKCFLTNIPEAVFKESENNINKSSLVVNEALFESEMHYDIDAPFEVSEFSHISEGYIDEASIDNEDSFSIKEENDSTIKKQTTSLKKTQESKITKKLSKACKESIKTKNKPDAKRIKRKYVKRKQKGEKPIVKEKVERYNIFTAEENKLRNEIIEKYYGKFKCDICETETDTYRGLKNHFQQEHKKRGYIKCCGTKFDQRFRLIDHVQAHLNPDHFKCDICEKVLKNRVCLELHKANKHLDRNLMKHACEICGKRFAHPALLAAHKFVHTDEKQLQCDLCDKSFKSLMYLQSHVTRMHKDKQLYICDICGKEYKFKMSFKIHINEHKGLPEPMGKCTICEKSVKSRLLKRHMGRHQIQEFKCNLCGKIKTNKGALESHIKYTHTKILFPCPYCDKTYKKQVSLKEHIDMHTGAKDHNCPHCPREFRSKSNMYAHVKKVHVDEWTKAQEAKNKV